ncbi:hypothetical protein Tco_1318091 [Tanacetum coccineum]
MKMTTIRLVLSIVAAGAFLYGSLEDTSTQHKSEGFQLAGQNENLVGKGASNMPWYSKKMVHHALDNLIEMKDKSSKKQVLGYVLTVGVTTVEWESRLQKSITMVLIFVKDSWNEEPCSDVHQVGDEREVKVLRSFTWPPSELITDDGVLPERVQRVLYVRRYRKVRAVALLKGRWFEVYRDYLSWRTVK